MLPAGLRFTKPIATSMRLIACVGALGILACGIRSGVPAPPSAACGASAPGTQQLLLQRRPAVEGMPPQLVVMVRSGDADRDPLSRAAVWLLTDTTSAAMLETQGSTTTDSTGRARLVAPRPGRHLLIVRRIGYERLDAVVDVRRDAFDTAYVRLAASSYCLSPSGSR